MDRRGFLTALGAGAVAGLAPAHALAAISAEDMSQPVGRFPQLFGTREYFIGDTVAKLPRARPALAPLGRETLDAFAYALSEQIPHPASGGSSGTAVIGAARRLDPVARMKLVNDFANRMPYIEDIDNFGMSDYWATPATFFRVGGDCEDFALAKYKLLEILGFHPARMRIVLLVDDNRKRQHAILAVNSQDRAWMLDSLVRDVVPHDTVAHYRPTVSLSGERLYLHVAPKT
jgi:predicted transglutaminase-like cysteine proteinase